MQYALDTSILLIDDVDDDDDDENEAHCAVTRVRISRGCN